MTRPENTNVEAFLADVEPRVRLVTARMLYNDPEMRASFVEWSDSSEEADTISFESFQALSPSVWEADGQGEAAVDAALLDVLGNAYRDD